ncbi:MAG: porin [Panacibacter sp.]
MILLLRKSISLTLFFLLLFSQTGKAQFLMDMVDTTKDMGKGLLSIYKKYDRIRMGGYIQPQFQAAESRSAKNYSGGDFATNSSNRFMLRRGRLRFDYIHFSENTKPSVQFVFQFDGSERGVFIRDFWGRVFENNAKLFSFTTGMFARPFGYELNLSSADRESPERGRMSQILMKTERDLGAMISFEPRGRTNWLQYLKLDAGFFNGQGLTATADFDSYKDFISRVSLKPYPLNKNLKLSVGVSYLNGGFIQNNKYVLAAQKSNGFTEDSSAANVGNKLPRKYYGVDAQLKFLHPKNSSTELRAEYWWGTQTSNAIISETPPALLTEPYYIRPFTGAFFYLLHNFDKNNQVGVKYDWYDANTGLKGTEIGTITNTHAADINFNTLGFGYTHYFDDNLKLVAWYEFVKNETTALPGYTSNVKDNILTLRMQFRF